ncbi:hypothetical protein Ocin01_00222 [Orchesella cincta]|uniref:Uncharacterized protein n=1 Tax=Orchesella cincta TaxID=48709 RepID=A0A1D2NMH9_ORCCI|nr:hypothetical protein Ocin01_00222 [Orchesella cincta]
MRFSTFLVIISSLVGLCISKGRQFQNFQNNQANINQNQQGLQGMLNRQVAGISFAIPGLSLLAGNNNGGVGGNFFGPVTVTRTVVSTVSTVTTQSFRTCTTSAAALVPCGAGRRKRDTDPENNELAEGIHVTPTMELIIGSTTITDQKAVTEYLAAHKPSNQSVIYPPGIDESKLTMNPRFESISDNDHTTILYPSQDTPEATDSSLFLENGEVSSDDIAATTETPYFNDDIDSGTTPNTDLEVDDEKARVGLGRTTTLTTVIRVTSVATTLATGTGNTLSIMYGGCMPQSLPVSGIPCMA